MSKNNDANNFASRSIPEIFALNLASLTPPPPPQGVLQDEEDELEISDRSTLKKIAARQEYFSFNSTDADLTEQEFNYGKMKKSEFYCALAHLWQQFSIRLILSHS